MEPWASIQLEIGEIRAVDDRVLIEIVVGARGEGSGVEPPALHTWQVFWMANGMATRRRVFRERDQALEAAGMRD